MQELNLPKYSVKIKEENNKTYIFDEIRQKYLILTPEEWVRQNFLKYLVTDKGYSKSLISLEKKVVVNGQAKRFDALIYNKEVKPVLIIEFKSYDVKITQQVFEQASRYNYTIQASYLIVSNGMNHFCAKIDFENQQFNFLKEIPMFSELN